MGVEGVFICTKEGRLVFYRDYGAVPHSLFEDLAFALPASLAKDSQCCFFAHGAHRLVFLPLEALFVVMVTPRHSNIIEDVETIGNVKDVIHHILAPKLNEEAVTENYANLTFAFDDMISLGTRNAFSRTQVQALLEMESSNEKLQQAILLGKEKEAKKRTEEEARKIERSMRAKEIIAKEFKEIDESIKKFADTDPGIAAKRATTPPKIEPTAAAEKLSTKGVRGLQLKAPKKETTRTTTQAPKKVEEKPEPAEEMSFNPLSEEVELSLEEKVSGSLGVSGTWNAFELKGVLRATQMNPKLDRFSVELGNPKLDPRLNIRLPPMFDKKRWGEGVLAFKEGSAGLTPNTPTETLKYGIALGAAGFAPPFKLTTWPGANDFSAELEFDSSQTVFKRIEKLSLEFKISDRLGATIRDYSGSDAFNVKSGFRWVVANFGPDNPSATFEIECKKGLRVEDLFPVEVTIESKDTCLDLGELAVRAGDGRLVKFKFTKTLEAKDLKIE